MVEALRDEAIKLIFGVHFLKKDVNLTDYHLRHRIKEADMGFRGLIMVQCFLWALKCFD
jgi:hypothetical protein